jgi:pyruvate dehydrogenase E2 component (dihydrolipoamide acetyltransferase)
MVGGNFTISNLGGIGGTGFAPIIYWPQVAILGISRAIHQPVYVNGQLERRLVLPLSVSYDHRIIDGAEGARFIKWVAEALQKPFLLAIQD